MILINLIGCSDNTDNENFHPTDTVSPTLFDSNRNLTDTVQIIDTTNLKDTLRKDKTRVERDTLK